MRDRPLPSLDELHEVTGTNSETIRSTTSLTGRQGLPGDLTLHLRWQRDHSSNLKDIDIVHGIAPEGRPWEGEEDEGQGRKEGRGRLPRAGDVRIQIK
jgi:hypothetical protein